MKPSPTPAAGSRADASPRSTDDGGAIRCLMIGMGRSTFGADWANAVGRFAQVMSVTSVSEFTDDVTMVDRRIAISNGDGYPKIQIIPQPFRPKRLFWRLNARADAKLIARAARLLTDKYGEIHLIHSHGYADAAPVPLLARRWQLPYVHTEHSSNLAADDPRRFVSRAGLSLIRRLYREAATVMFVGEEQKRAAEALSLEGRLQVVPNPVDDSIFGHPHSTPDARHHLVTVGYLHARKRMDLLLRAVAQARSKVPDLHLDIVGGGAEREPLQDLARHLDIDDIVRFHGTVARPEVASLLESADLYVHTSERESFGVSIIEALLAGVPVVAVRCGGVTGELPEWAATIIDRPETSELADAIVRGLRERPYAPGVDIASWARRSYGVEAVARQIEVVYHRALRSTGSDGPAEAQEDDRS